MDEAVAYTRRENAHSINSSFLSFFVSKQNHMFVEHVNVALIGAYYQNR